MFEKIIGYTAIKREMEMIVDTLSKSEKYSRFGVTPPRGILFYGEPGIGKSLMAKSIIEASGRKAFTIRKDRPNGEFVNYIKEVFEQAKANTPSIVFMDDLDKFSDNATRYNTDTEEFATIQACIDELEDCRVFIIATANDVDVLPESLKRPGRFDKVIQMHKPLGNDAKQIVEYFLAGKRVVEDLEINEIANLLCGESCATIEAIVNDAAIYAGFEGRETITQKDVIRAYLRRLFASPENDDVTENYSLEEVAVHEAGHTLVSELLYPKSITLVAVDTERGNIRGVTSTLQDKTYSSSVQEKKNKIMIALAGKAATEVVYGFTDIGAKNDLIQAFSIVESLVDDYCEYGFDCAYTYLSAEEVNAKRDELIGIEVARYYSETKRLLLENRKLLDTIIKILTDKKVIISAELDAIFNNQQCGL